MGGIRKTTLVKKVYNHVDVKRRFDCLTWVFISQQCNPKEVLLRNTTRIKGVALHADPCNTPVELSFLTDDQSWKLFIIKAFPQNKTDPHACPRAFEKLGREMVKKCGGLPLAIVVLGGLLATKQTQGQ
ncbi:hypothetical protein V6N13_038398 [Hibiscus sabdariffa]